MKKSYDQKIDRDIKKCLNDETDGISAPEDMFFKIRNEILRKEEEENFNMKYKFLRPKTALIAGIICVLTTVTCVAATNLSGWYGSSSKLTESKSFPSETTVESKVGFTPKYVKEFNNEFKFDTFNYSDNSIKDEKGNDIEKFKGAEFTYKKEDSKKDQSLTISADKIDEKYLDENTANNAVEEQYKGIKIEYTSSPHKSVPEGYELSEEEKELQDKGLLQIAYGSESDEVTVDEVQAVVWNEDGISYCILNSNYTELTQEDMINMAKEIIDQK